jgi:uncharacterized Ntn-hydrolase superfamily protein
MPNRVPTASVPWARFGVGAVVTQAMTDPSYGWRGLDAMASGLTPRRALDSLLSDDDQADRRQVAFMDSDGTVVVHTGARCLQVAGHEVGDGWAVLGNMLWDETVLPAMAEAFEKASGTLAERIVEALAAAEGAGGDVRGSQSGAIRVVPGARDLAQRQEAGIDISVADHPDPIAELRRLVSVDRSYRELRRGETAVAEGDEAEALRHLDLASRLRHGVEVDFWRAVALARLGRSTEAVEIMGSVVAAAPHFHELLVRLGEVDRVAAGLLAALR